MQDQRNMLRISTVFLCAVMLFLGACSRPAEQTGAAAPQLTVITTLFPLYDFTRAIAGDRADVQLLLPPGAEAHSFEPRPSDMARLSKADLFVFTSARMEPWADKVFKGAQNPRLTAVDTSVGIAMAETGEDRHGHPGDRKKKHGHRDDHDDHGTDPHIWLDFSNAAKMAATIRDALIAKDPEGREVYAKNALKLAADLDALDKKYVAMLATCEKKTLVSGGHFAFGYLATRYGLSYQSAYGFSPSAEPSPRDLMRMTSMLRKQEIKYLFYEELIEPRVAETIAKETGVTLIMLHGAHNISRDDFHARVTFGALMERNYEALRKGLKCR